MSRNKLALWIPRLSRQARAKYFAVAALVCLALAALGLPANASGLASKKPAGHAPPFLWPAYFPYPPVYNFFSPSFNGTLDNMVLLPLAIQLPDKLNAFSPQLASSWSVSSNAMVVHIRKHARWQNGSPVTAEDVLAAAVLSGVTGGGPYTVASRITIKNPSTVVFDLRPHELPITAEPEILGLFPIYRQSFASVLSPKLTSEVALSLNPSYSGAAAGSAKANEYKAVASTLASKTKTLEGLHQHGLVGDGPFKVTSMSDAGTLLKKWPGFWDANKIHVNEISETNPSASNLYGLIANGESTFQTFPLPWNIFQRDEHTPYLRYHIASTYSGLALYFNERKYPLNILGVRKALAYVINRKRLLELEDGGHTVSEWVRHPDGLLSQVQRLYLSKSQISSLNAYPYDPSRGAAMLERLGFKRTSSGWLTPKGKPFTLKMSTPGGYPDAVLFGTALATALTHFGIRTTSSAIELPGYWTDLTNGNFDLGWGWGATGQTDPLVEFQGVLGTYDFASSTEPGMAFGPTTKLPSVGTVNVHSAIDNEASNVGSKKRIAALTWDWARVVNEQLPYLSYADKNTPLFYSTAHYVDWPPSSSSLWSVAGVNFQGGVMLMLERGYIRPR